MATSPVRSQPSLGEALAGPLVVVVAGGDPRARGPAARRVDSPSHGSSSLGVGLDDAELDARPTGRPCAARSVGQLVLRQVGHACVLIRPTVPTGWSRSCPRPAGSAGRSARGRPPTAPWAPPSRRTGWPAATRCRGPPARGSTPIQMVGTPAATVTCSSSMRSRRWPPGDRSGPGITRSAPGSHRGVGQAPGVGVEHGHDRQDRRRLSRTPRLSAVMRAEGVQVASSGGE